jgi:hypothetical protein
MQIRSYRTVFELERRIYRLDRLRLNPAGLPVRGVVYGAVVLLAALATSDVPLLGACVRVSPWYLRDLVAPVLLGSVLCTVRVEGRPFHLTALSLTRYTLASRHLAGLRRCPRPGARWRPPEILIYADGSEGHLRRLKCEGPGVVRVAPAHERVEWELGALGGPLRRPEVTLAELVGRRPPTASTPIALAACSRLRVR